MFSETSSQLPVITLTLTPAVDVAVSVSTMVPGSLHRLPELRQDPGGKGINVSKALHSFRVPTTATGLLGGDRGRWIENQLDEAGIDNDFVHITAETRMNVKVTEESGRLTEFNTMSPAGTEEEWAELEARLASAKSGQWIALCGRLPEGTDPKWYQKAISRAKKNGVGTILDSSGDGFLHGIEAKPDIVKPNRAELSHWAGKNLDDKRHLLEAAQALTAKGIQTVVVSLGYEGVVAVTPDAAYEIKVPQVDAVSTVGAGDTLVAGLLYGTYHDYSFTEAIQFAAAAGTAAVSTPGTVQPMLDDVKHILPKVTIHELALK